MNGMTTPQSDENPAPRKKITELTQADLEICDEVREKWRELGLSTQPANRAEAEAGLEKAYKAAELEPPKFAIWTPSPWAGALVQAVAPDAIAKALTRFKAQMPALMAMAEQEYLEQQAAGAPNPG